VAGAPELIGHAAIRRELRALARSPRPAHAILLAGPESTGRRPLARFYARLLDCERIARDGAPAPAEPCGECRACRLIAEDAHPDVLFLAPGDVLCRPRAGDASHPPHAESRDIRICQVRGTLELVARYPFEAPYRAVIIDPADRMTPDAANTLLKTLEEPPSHSVFVLITSAPDQLLETIASRCRRIDVPAVATSVIEAALTERGIESAIARDAAAAARGRPGLALQYARKPDLMGDRQRLLQRCARLAAASLGERFRYSGELWERWRNDRAPVFRELDVWEEFWERDLNDAAHAGDLDATTEALAALKTVATAREYLLANVLSRTVFDFMLVSFPGRTLGEGSSDAAAGS
jgi:DNA polymerase-3 subunit delta'